MSLPAIVPARLLLGQFLLAVTELLPVLGCALCVLGCALFALGCCVLGCTLDFKVSSNDFTVELFTAVLFVPELVGQFGLFANVSVF
jgi:hypothetical protein